MGIVTGSQTAKLTPALEVATGLTVAVTIVTGPSHPFAVGVIVYVTVPTFAFVVLKVSLMTLPFPLEAEPATLAVATAVQLNVVPATSLGVASMLIVAVCPLQIITFDAVAEGNGFTVATKSIGNPLQPLKLGVILYDTVPELLLVFTGASLIGPEPAALKEPAIMFALAVAVHVNVVPGIDPVGTKLSASPLQICCEYDGAELVNTGTGFTVAVTLYDGPGHPLAEGVIVYTTVPLPAPLALTNN
jgi:hypothetical protein